MPPKKNVSAVIAEEELLIEMEDLSFNSLFQKLNNSLTDNIDSNLNLLIKFLRTSFSVDSTTPTKLIIDTLKNFLSQSEKRLKFFTTRFDYYELIRELHITPPSNSDILKKFYDEILYPYFLNLIETIENLDLCIENFMAYGEKYQTAIIPFLEFALPKVDLLSNDQNFIENSSSFITCLHRYFGNNDNLKKLFPFVYNSILSKVNSYVILNTILKELSKLNARPSLASVFLKHAVAQKELMARLFKNSSDYVYFVESLLNEFGSDLLSFSEMFTLLQPAFANAIDERLELAYRLEDLALLPVQPSLAIRFFESVLGQKELMTRFF